RIQHRWGLESRGAGLWHARISGGSRFRVARVANTRRWLYQPPALRVARCTGPSCHARSTVRGWPFLRSLILDRTQASTVPRPRRSSVRDLPCQNLCGIEKGGIARRCTTVTVEEKLGRSLSACRPRRKGPGLSRPL